MLILREKSFGWFKNYINKYYKLPQSEYKPTYSELPKKKTPGEILSEMKEIMPDRISPSHLEAIKLDKEIGKIYPGLGDGDEYPRLRVNHYYDENYNDEYTCIGLGVQGEPLYKWCKDHWEDINSHGKPRRISNIKQDMINYIKKEIPSWERDEYMWGEEDSTKVAEFLRREIELISRSSLR